MSIKKIIASREVAGIIFIIIITVSILLFANSTGISGTTKKNNNLGCWCHGTSPTVSVSVNIIGPDTLAPGATGNYELTISGGPLVRAGTDIAASSGTLKPVSSDLHLLSGDLTHSSPKAPSNGMVTFQFKYTAPSSAGTQTLYANGNSVNGDGKDNSQDKWNFAPNKTVVITNATGIAGGNNLVKNFTLEQNYPNPFNPSTVIGYQIPMGSYVTLKIYDALGREIAELVNDRESAGTYKVNFNGSRLPSGIYFYTLTSGNYKSTKKMLLLK
jgi:Secretion system C-terminal sorting domain